MKPISLLPEEGNNLPSFEKQTTGNNTTKQYHKIHKVILTNTQKTLLTNITKKTTSSLRLVFRSGIILTYAQTGSKPKAAKQLKTSRDAVYRWVIRWQECGEELARLEEEYSFGHLSLSAYQSEIGKLLRDAPRPGHPPVFNEEQKQKILALAAEDPETADVPITNWTYSTIRDTVIQKGIVLNISLAQVGRFLKESRFTTPPEPVLGASEHNGLG